MRRSILLVALLILMSFPSVEAFAATETIVQKGAKLGDLVTEQGQMASDQAFHMIQANLPDAQVDGRGTNKLIDKVDSYDGTKEDPYYFHEIDDEQDRKGH